MPWRTKTCPPRTGAPLAATHVRHGRGRHVRCRNREFQLSTPDRSWHTDRRSVIQCEVTQIQRKLARAQMTGSFSWDTAPPRYLVERPR